MTNNEIYNAFRAVPKEAQKTIGAGRLKGFTDINPMWRIKMLTEKFGPCGLGWYTEIIDQWTESSPKTEEIGAFVKINLYIKTEEGWSKPIVGIGGSSLVTRESKGLYFSDEAFKMAYTDALSIACKALGMAADIYFDKDKSSRDNTTKYDQPAPTPEPAPAPAPAPAAPAPAPAEKKPVGIKERWIKALAEKAVNDKGVDAETAYKEKFNPTPEEWALIQDEVYHYKKDHNIQ